MFTLIKSEMQRNFVFVAIEKLSLRIGKAW